MSYNTGDWPALPPMSALVNKVHCMDALELLALLPSGSVDLILTDPPYTMTKRGRSSRPNWMYNNMGENLFEGDLIRPEEWFPELFRVLKKQTHCYVFCSINDITQFLVIAQSVGFELHTIISMIKDTHTPNQWYMKYCEWVLFFRKGAAKPINSPNSRDYFNVRMPTLHNGKEHITQKPISFIEHLVANSSCIGEIVLDPFAGSGTTAIGAKNLGRNFIANDSDFNCVITANRRLSQPYTPLLFTELTA